MATKARFKVGDKVKVAASCDNDSYDSFRGKPLVVNHVARAQHEHPGYDSGIGEALYSFDGIPCSLYDYELERF